MNTATTPTTAKQYGIYATCRSPRAEVLKTAKGYLSQVKVTARGWMQSAYYPDAETALTVCREYIREASQGRVDPHKALKVIWK
jgi:hypothetical protein